MYALNASHDYDPSPDLHKTTAPLSANTADNPTKPAYQP